MFDIGDRIAHPMHGAGIINGIEEKKINGTTRSYYVLNIPVGGMVVLIPIDSSEAIGVRPIIDSETADKVIDSMADIKVDMTQNWNRRYRENMMRIKSGDLNEVARVIKGLVERENEKGLSTGERKMLRSAKQILISEIVLSQNSTYEEVENRINNALT
ncbi:MAG: CarD family transcriptional regulator [Oscillospiraceae bacterium]